MLYAFPPFTLLQPLLLGVQVEGVMPPRWPHMPWFSALLYGHHVSSHSRENCYFPEEPKLVVKVVVPLGCGHNFAHVHALRCPCTNLCCGHLMGSVVGSFSHHYMCSSDLVMSVHSLSILV